MTSAAFDAEISRAYQRHLVPLIFEPYAATLARRLAARPPARVLEVAAGTGVVTRALADTLPNDSAITATDVSAAMLAEAARVGTSRPVAWRQADALQLPFDDATFDAVVCQFGVMFFPDRPRAFAEARRVLAPGGVLLFSVWDRLEENEMPDVVTDALATLFPDDPPSFMRRVPHGYHDPAVIARDLALGGFTDAPLFETETQRSRADSPAAPAVAFCQGTPMRAEIERRAPGRLAEATAVAERAIARRFGGGAVDGKIQARVVTARV